MALRIDVNHSDAYAALGELLWSVGSKHEAELNLRKALDVDPENTLALLTIGHVLYDKGDVDGAERNMRRSCELMPTNAGAHFSLGARTAAGNLPRPVMHLPVVFFVTVPLLRVCARCQARWS